MAHLRSRRRRLIAVPLGLALTASLGFLPAGASAAPQTAPAAEEAEGPLLSYVVNSKADPYTLKRVRKAIAGADGSVVTTHKKIGVTVAHSTNPDFGAELRSVRGVQSAGATRTAPLTPLATTDVGETETLTAAEAAKAAAEAKDGQEPLEPNLWGLRSIKADQAHKINPGSSKVTVGVIDTGVDDTHPDLAPNFAADKSANCVTGVPDTTEGAWRPYADGSDHGTHVAGTIAAPRNGIGVAGVAPGVKVSGIKVSTPKDGFFYAEAVVCAFMFAADKGIDITNNSYYVDPWLFNCVTHPDQKAIVDALTRATRFAERKGTVNIGSAGNSNVDLAADELPDSSSPNDSTPVDRVIDPSECPDVPTQLPAVMSVSATGVEDGKSWYSTYGLGEVDVAAPGGDSRYQIPDTPDADGRILSTVLNGEYGYKQGTSMASPHAAGVLALLKSAHPEASAQQLKWLLKLQANPAACPTEYDPDGDGETNATCEGGKYYNGFYGHGIVDALKAVRW
ncbi:S8 family serine peptidase [Streptomyces sp. E11-3]|uniref:S8 family serine peptidase n=1 Tax=Streptomyces sp. E11-3 TaxID=3110112 RepID=UPI00397F32F1